MFKKRKRISSLFWRDLLLGFCILLIVCGVTAYIVFTHDFQIAGRYVKRVATDQKVVALTFDDGPTDNAVGTLLPILKSHNVRATFYVIGSEIERFPEAARRLAQAGHELGNHGYSHLSLAFASQARIRYEIETTDRLIRRSGYQGPITFRPPYGHKFITLPLYLAAHHRISASRDVAPDEAVTTTPEIIEYTVSHVRPGSIILLHTMYEHYGPSLSAVQPIIEQLQAKGYRFVTFSELLEI